MESLSEADVQRAIARCLDVSAAFRRAFLLAVEPPSSWGAEHLRLASAKQSVMTANGESDVDTRWSANDGKLYAILCEVKLTAQFMPKQGERYRQRAAGLVSGGHAASAITILVAHSTYLRAANPEARHFDRAVRLDELPGWTSRDADPQLEDEIKVLREAVTRMAEGKPLGTKGLFTDLHQGVAAEFTRRGNGLAITNNNTDWVYIKIPGPPCPSVWINYRVRQAIPEIRIRKAFGGDRDELTRRCAAPLQLVTSGSDLFLRLPALEVSSEARRGTVNDAEVAAIVDACEWLAEWWLSNYRLR